MKRVFPLGLKLLLCTVLIMTITVSGFSQDEGSCAENLKLAQSLFEKGQVEQVPELLSHCLKSGFSREESLSAFKLIIQSYLFEENQKKSDSTMLEFLKKNPEYQLSPTDHSSLVYLYNNYQVKSLIKISLHMGTNIPFLTGIKPVSVSIQPAGSIYKTGMTNLYASLEAKVELGKRLEINIEPAYSQLSFTNIRDRMWDNKKIGVTIYTETQRRIEVPVSTTYDFMSFKKMTFYGRVGIGPAFTMHVMATPDYKYTDVNTTPHTGSDIDRKADRVSVDLFAQAGSGLKYKIRGGFLFTELRGNLGIFDQVIRHGLSPEEQELGETYFYSDDDFHLNEVNFTIGYTYIFYKPSKIK